MQIFAFATLYAIWALPETILIRHICLIMGALCGLYGIYQYQGLLLRKINSLTVPAWLLLGLFAWATFHLVLLGNNFSWQMEEYSSILKRTALGAIFALGLGLTLANANQQKLRTYCLSFISDSWRPH